MGDLINSKYEEMKDKGLIPKTKLIQYFTNRKNLVEQFIDYYPVHYDESRNWWIWNHNKSMWKLTDEVNIINDIDDAAANVNTLNSRERNEIIEGLRQVGRKRKPKQVNKQWIQFKDVIIDIKTNETFDATPQYFVTNPIPWRLGKSDETPMMDKLFTEWVGEDNIKTLYQILAYCCIPDYPIHRIFCFIGGGCNGKSQFLKLLRKFIGPDNCVSTELDSLLMNRFEKTKLFKKLVCQMGETNFNEMSQTSLLKKLSGGDLIGFEFKNKDPFDAENYAKIIIATNTLPTTTDKTLGFYRRWMIIDFPNRFSENGGDVIDYIPQKEYNNLAKKSLRIIRELLENYQFHNEGTIEERADKYEEKSNPFEKFWKENIVEDFDSNIFKFELKDEFTTWCKKNGFRKLSDREIKHKMSDKNVDEGKRDYFNNSDSESKRYMAWLGIKWKDTTIKKEETPKPQKLIDIIPEKGSIRINQMFEHKNLDPFTMDEELDQLKREGIIAEDKTLGKSAFAIDFAKRIEKYFKEHPDKIMNGGKQ